VFFLGYFDSLRIFEFAKNVLRNSLVLLSIVAPKKENLSLSFSLIVAAFYLPPFANGFLSGGGSFGVRSG
jgi:hypothetical protein